MDMNKLIVLGTGNAMVTRCYNTCFAIACPNGENILVDAGGGNGILVQLKNAGLEPSTIHHLIVTHEHCDHLLGVVWIVRKIGTMMLGGKYEGNLNVYCHAGLRETIVTLCKLTLQKKFVNLFGNRILLHVVENGTKMDLAGQQVEFFDILSTKAPQFGFSMITADGKNGQLVRTLETGGYPVFLCHWQSLISNGLGTGLRILEEVGKRIQENLSDRVEWMRYDEIRDLVLEDKESYKKTT